MEYKERFERTQQWREEYKALRATIGEALLKELVNGEYEYACKHPAFGGNYGGYMVGSSVAGYTFVGVYTDKLVELLGRDPIVHDLELLFGNGNGMNEVSVTVNSATRAVVATVEYHY